MQPQDQQSPYMSGTTYQPPAAPAGPAPLPSQNAVNYSSAYPPTSAQVVDPMVPVQAAQNYQQPQPTQPYPQSADTAQYPDVQNTEPVQAENAAVVYDAETQPAAYAASNQQQYEQSIEPQLSNTEITTEISQQQPFDPAVTSEAPADIVAVPSEVIPSAPPAEVTLFDEAEPATQPENDTADDKGSGFVDSSQWFKEDGVPYLQAPPKVSVPKTKIVMGIAILAVLLIGGGATYALVLNKKHPATAEPAKTAQASPSTTSSNSSESSEQTTTTPTSPAAATPTPAPAPTSQTTTSTAPKTTTKTSSSTSSSTTVTHATYSVVYSNCFSPATITIKSGDTVRFVNSSNSSFWPISDPHPKHTDYPEFNAGKSYAPGTTYAFTFTRVGTWGYHDELKKNCGGTVIVK